MYCKKCGTKIDPKDNYCIECGTKIVKNFSPNSKRNTIILIAVIILAVFLTVTRGITFIKSIYSIISQTTQNSSNYNNYNNNYNNDYNYDYDDSPQDDYDYNDSNDYYNTEKNDYNFNTITVDDYLKLKNKAETNIIYIGRNSCRACLQEEIILYALSEKLDLTINYLNISNITTEDYEKLQSSDEFFQNNWSIPLIILVKDGKIIERLEGLKSINQLLETFKNNDLLNKN